MSSLIRILSLLSALAATSYALTCTRCISDTSTCSGPIFTCPSGHQCGTEYSETDFAGIKSTSLGRICASSSQCGFKGSMGLKQGHIRMSISCCNTDNCTTDLPTLPAISSNPNGLVCRYCTSIDSTWCHTDDRVKCTGDQNMCLLQTTHVSGSVSASYAIRGCATKSYCDLGSQSTSVEGVTTDVKHFCTNSGLSVHNIVLTPAIVCLLLLKLFF